MDVIGLSKNGIENVVANLGTSLTEKQILTLNQFLMTSLFVLMEMKVVIKLPLELQKTQLKN